MSNDDKKKTLNPVVSDDVMQRASAALGDIVKAMRWLKMPNRALNGVTPISKLGSLKGTEEIIMILHKIESGEFS